MDSTKALTLLMAAALVAASFICGRFFSGQISHDTPEVVRDTIRDTIRVQGPRDTLYLPSLDTIRVPVPVHDTLARTDTLWLELPRERVQVSDTAFTAWISGWRPQLDSIEIYRQTITETRTLPAPRWSIGIQGGVGVTPAGLQPYLGVGISYRIPLGK